MVLLIGCAPGGAINFLNQEVRKFFPRPNPKLLDLITGLSSGTKVGIEVLAGEDQAQLEPYLAKEVERLERLPYVEGPVILHWDEQTRLYWAELISSCRASGKQDLALENKVNWQKYLDKVVAKFRIREHVYNRVLFKRDGESNFHYDIKLCKCNDLRHNAAVAVQKIHVLDRDARLLESIAATKPEVVCVSKAFSDRWVSNPKIFEDATGLEITGYNAEHPFFEERSMQCNWVEDSVPDPKLVAEFATTQRAVNLMERNRLDPSKTPDFVGLYDPYEPSKGYFEVFVDRAKTGFSGTIIDQNGIAEFDGTKEANIMRFTKRYLKGDSIARAAEEPIDYDLTSIKGGFFGFYCTNTSTAPVYLQGFEGQKPIKLAIAYHRALQAHGKKIRPRMKRALALRGKPGQVII